MNYKELKNIPKEELKNKLAEQQKELMKENAQVAIGTAPKNPGKISNIKKTIAKIKSILDSEV